MKLCVTRERRTTSNPEALEGLGTHGVDSFQKGPVTGSTSDMRVGSGFGQEAEDKRKHVILCSHRTGVSGQALLPLGNRTWGSEEMCVSTHRDTQAPMRKPEPQGEHRGYSFGSKESVLWAFVHHRLGSHVIYRVRGSYGLFHEGSR